MYASSPLNHLIRSGQFSATSLASDGAAWWRSSCRRTVSSLRCGHAPRTAACSGPLGTLSLVCMNGQSTVAVVVSVVDHTQTCSASLASSEWGRTYCGGVDIDPS